MCTHQHFFPFWFQVQLDTGEIYTNDKKTNTDENNKGDYENNRNINEYLRISKCMNI